MCKKARAFDPSCEVVYGQPLPRSKIVHNLLIDDLVFMTIRSSGSTGRKLRERTDSEWNAGMTEYAASCGKPVREKTQRHLRFDHAWGSRIDGVGGPPERLAVIADVALHLAV